MKLAKFSNLINWVLVGFLLLTTASVLLTFNLSKQHRAELNRLHVTSDAVGHLQISAYELTRHIRSYAMTTHEQYLQDYLALRDKSQRDDLGFQDFLNHQLSSRELEFLLEARLQASRLDDLHIKALNLTREGHWAVSVRPTHLA